MNNNQSKDLRFLQNIQAELLYSETEEKTEENKPELDILEMDYDQRVCRAIADCMRTSLNI